MDDTKMRNAERKDNVTPEQEAKVDALNKQTLNRPFPGHIDPGGPDFLMLDGVFTVYDLKTLVDIFMPESGGPPPKLETFY